MEGFRELGPSSLGHVLAINCLETGMKLCLKIVKFDSPFQLMVANMILYGLEFS